MFPATRSIGIPLFCVLSLFVALREARAQDCSDVIEPKLKQQFQAALADPQVKPIYGCDDRRNFYDPALSDTERTAAQATAVLVWRTQLKAADAQQSTWDLQPQANPPRRLSAGGR